MKLQGNFYLDEDVTKIARLLLGKSLMVRSGEHITGGMIVETEAYSGAIDKASHAFKNKHTQRTSVMFGRGGLAYVYLCYGIHHLFNVVTNKEGCPDAVLIRAVQPVEMSSNGKDAGRNIPAELITLTNGPGKLSKALGIDLMHNGEDLTGDKIWIEDTGFNVSTEMVVHSKRIGVDYAGNDANLKWRFYLRNNKWVSVK